MDSRTPTHEHTNTPDNVQQLEHPALTAETSPRRTLDDVIVPISPHTATPITWELFSPGSQYLALASGSGPSIPEPESPSRLKPRKQRGLSVSMVDDVLQPSSRRRRTTNRPNVSLLTLQQSIEALREENDYLRDIIIGTQQRREAQRRAMQSGVGLFNQDSSSSATSSLLSPFSRTYSLPTAPSYTEQVPIVEVVLSLSPSSSPTRPQPPSRQK